MKQHQQKLGTLYRLKLVVDRNASVSLLDLSALTFVPVVDNARTSMRQV